MNAKQLVEFAADLRLDVPGAKLALLVAVEGFESAEITRLRAEVEALKLQGAAAELVHRETATTVLVQMAEVEALRAKATAFDWLQAEHDRFDPMARCVIKRSMDRRNGDWIEFIDGENFAAIVLREASIDAARAAQGDKP